MVLSNILVNLGAILWYELDKSYIVNELCENKENIEIECNGNCALRKAMVMATPVQENNDNTFKISVEFLNFIVPAGSTGHTLQTSAIKVGIHERNSIPSTYTSDIFHPPKIG